MKTARLGSKAYRGIITTRLFASFQYTNPLILKSFFLHAIREAFAKGNIPVYILNTLFGPPVATVADVSNISASV